MGSIRLLDAMGRVLTSMVAGRCYWEILRTKGVGANVMKREETPYWVLAHWAKGGQVPKGVSVIAHHGIFHRLRDLPVHRPCRLPMSKKRGSLSAKVVLNGLSS